MRPASPAHWLPKDMHCKLIIALVACFRGDPDEGVIVDAHIKAFGNPGITSKEISQFKQKFVA